MRVDAGVVVEVGGAPQPGDEVLHANGWLLLPAMAEAHAHLDKAFLAETVPNPRGDLMGAIEAMETYRDRITLEDTIVRAERAARLIARNGATAIRTHADLTTQNGLMSVQALVEVRDRLRDIIHIEVIALCGWPIVGPVGADQRALLRDAIDVGVDGVGGCPHLESDPHGANDLFLTMAAEAGLPVDLHTDETLDPSRFALPDLVKRVMKTGFSHGVTASHCVSLGMQPDFVQQAVSELIAQAGISVVALPSSNMYLQGRDQQVGMPRALTAVRALRRAGANLAAGADNLQDPFNLVGRGDCLETASLMVMAGHLLPEHAYHSVSGAVRAAMRLPTAGTEVGDTADLVLINAGSVREAVAFGPGDRIVIRAGQIIRG